MKYRDDSRDWFVIIYMMVMYGQYKDKDISYMITWTTFAYAHEDALGST